MEDRIAPSVIKRAPANEIFPCPYVCMCVYTCVRGGVRVPQSGLRKYFDFEPARRADVHRKFLHVGLEGSAMCFRSPSSTGPFQFPVIFRSYRYEGRAVYCVSKFFGYFMSDIDFHSYLFRK